MRKYDGYKTLNQVMAELSPEQRKQVEKRTKELIEEVEKPVNGPVTLAARSADF